MKLTFCATCTWSSPFKKGSGVISSVSSTFYTHTRTTDSTVGGLTAEDCDNIFANRASGLQLRCCPIDLNGQVWQAVLPNKLCSLSAALLGCIVTIQVGGKTAAKQAVFTNKPPQLPVWESHKYKKYLLILPKFQWDCKFLYILQSYLKQLYKLCPVNLYELQNTSF